MPKVIHFGAGKIGRGFIGAVLNEAGHDVVFADVDKDIIDQINAAKEYTLHIIDRDSCSRRITGVSAVNTITLMKTNKSFDYWQWRVIICSMIGYSMFYFVRKNFSIASSVLCANSRTFSKKPVKWGIFFSSSSMILSYSPHCLS